MLDQAPPSPPSDELARDEPVDDAVSDDVTEEADALALITTLERRLTAISDRAMRRGLLLEAVLACSDEALVGGLILLVHRVGEGHPESRVLLQEIALEPGLLMDLPYERKQSAYTLAFSRGAQGIARMFLSPRHRSNPTSDESIRDNETLSMPLGLRRAAARTRDRMLLDRLCYDRNARVIGVLLDNPRLVERDVVKIAAMRPTQPTVLETVARHTRWTSSYRVRKALAANPYTPRPLALRLLPTLLVQDLRAVLSGCFDLDNHVAEEIRGLLLARETRKVRLAEGETVSDAGDNAIVDHLIARAAADEDPSWSPLDPKDVAQAALYEDDAVDDPFASGDAELLGEVEALLAEAGDLPELEFTAIRPAKG